MAKKYAKGWEGTLAIWDSTASAWKPVACLTSTSHAITANTTEKVNMCTQGKTETRIDSLTETVDFEGEVVDTTAVGGQSAESSLSDLKAIIRAEAANGSTDDFRLNRGFDGYIYFTGQILSISDSYAAGEDATFSGQLSIIGEPSETDPNS